MVLFFLPAFFLRILGWGSRKLDSLHTETVSFEINTFPKIEKHFTQNYG